MIERPQGAVVKVGGQSCQMIGCELLGRKKAGRRPRGERQVDWRCGAQRGGDVEIDPTYSPPGRATRPFRPRSSHPIIWQDWPPTFTTAPLRTLDHLKDNLPRLPDDAVERRDWCFVAGETSSLHCSSFLRMGRPAHPGPWRLSPRPGPSSQERLRHSSTSRASRRSLSPTGGPNIPRSKDVAGMLRSFSYAPTRRFQLRGRRPEAVDQLEPWARLWEHSTCAEFQRAYRDTIAPG